MITYAFKPEEVTDGVKVTRVKDRVIVKTGHETEFTLATMEDNEENLKTKQKEMQSVVEHRKAVMTNVEENHPIVKELTEEQRHAVHLYRQAEAELKEYETILVEVDKVLDKSSKEKAEIISQLGIEVNA